MDPNFKQRHVIDARRPIRYGGGACNLLLRCIDEHVELLFHAMHQTGAVMTRTQAVELAQALARAAESRETTAPQPLAIPRPHLVSCALRLSTATVAQPHNRNSQYCHVVDARRPIQYGGGACSVLLCSVDSHVELLFHAAPETGAVMTRAQAVELAQALARSAESRETTAPQPPGMPKPHLFMGQPPDYWSGSSAAVGAVVSDRIDKRRWWVFFAGHWAAVTRQQVVTHPALRTRGSVAQEGPGAPVARAVTQVLGKLVMHALASLDARIARATSQGHRVSGEMMPVTETLGRITDPASDDRG